MNDIVKDTPEVIEIEAVRVRGMISNAHRMLWRRFRGEPLWSLVSQLTGHGSRMSAEFCEKVNLNPFQTCGNKPLEPMNIEP